jgi:hypothetical protein
MPRDRRKFRKAKTRFNKGWKRTVRGLGRRVVIYLPSTRVECPNCYYDKVNRVSSGIPKVSPGDPNYFTVGRCPVCYGKGVLTTVRKRCIEGIVNWNPAGDQMNSFTFTQAGWEGATRVEVKTDPCHLDIIKQAERIVIDGINCKLSNPPIIRGLGSKQILVAHFFTTDKPRADSGETV